jgi:hypothetical protein
MRDEIEVEDLMALFDEVGDTVSPGFTGSASEYDSHFGLSMGAMESCGSDSNGLACVNEASVQVGIIAGRKEGDMMTVYICTVLQKWRWRSSRPFSPDISRQRDL